jgi:hypothetical protein
MKHILCHKHSFCRSCGFQNDYVHPGHSVAQRLRYYATSRKVVYSRPDDVE